MKNIKIQKRNTLKLIKSVYFVRFCQVVMCLTFSLYCHSQTYTNTTLLTPNGTAIEAKKLISSDFTQTQKNTYEQQLLNEFPNVTVLDQPTLTYNCHGYAWHLSEGNSEVRWINAIKDNGQANLSKYWTDASYMKVCNVNQGTKIHYYAGDHSAIKSEVAGKYESKWGSNCRVRHDPTDVPASYNGSQRTYYRRIELKPISGETCGNYITYSINNIGASSYSWSSSPELSGGSSSTQCTFTKLDNGYSWVKVKASWSGCSNRSSTRSDDLSGIIGGTVNQSGQNSILQSTMAISANSQAVITFSYLPNPASISVTKTGGSGTWSYNSSQKKLYVTLPSNGSIYFSVNGSNNTCGNYSRSLVFYAPSYDYNSSNRVSDYVVSPNPVKDFLQVRLSEGEKLSDWNSADEVLGITNVIIYDTGGKMMRRFDVDKSEGNILLDVNPLVPGTYNLVITNDSNEILHNASFIKVE